MATKKVTKKVEKEMLHCFNVHRVENGFTFEICTTNSSKQYVAGSPEEIIMALAGALGVEVNSSED